MNLLFLKTLAAGWLGVGALVLAVWSGVALWRRQPPGPAFAGVVSFVQVIVGLQLILGLVLMGQGRGAPGMHIMYGILAGAAAVGLQWARPRGGQPAGRGAGTLFTLSLLLLLVGLRAFEVIR